MHSTQLEYFIRIAEAGSLSRAASRLRLSQAAITRQLRGLEDELKVLLFYRDGRGMLLTKAGQQLHARAVEILKQIAIAKEEAMSSREAPVDLISVSVPRSFRSTITCEINAALQDKFPETKIVLSKANTSVALEGLANGEIDIAVVYDCAEANRLHSDPIVREHLYLISKKGDRPLGSPISIQRDLAGSPLVLPTKSHDLRRMFDEMSVRQKFLPNVATEIDGIASMLRLVKDGYGRAILPTSAIMDELPPELDASPIGDDHAVRPLAIVVAGRKTTDRSTLAIAKLFKEQISASIQKLSDHYDDEAGPLVAAKGPSPRQVVAASV